MLGGMSPRERPVDRGSRLARTDLVRIGGELRDARVSAGLSLAQVGAAVRMSSSQVGRIERAIVPTASVDQLARIGASVGLDVRIRTYPGPDPLRDAGQVALLDRLRARLAAGLTFRTEVPLRLPGDLRAWDGRIGGLRYRPPMHATLPVEGETRISDAQAQFRRLALKMRDDDEPAVLVVVADTRRNRAAASEAAAAIRELFPVSPRRAMAALSDGSHPGGSALVFL